MKLRLAKWYFPLDRILRFTTFIIKLKTMILPSSHWKLFESIHPSPHPHLRAQIRAPSLCSAKYPAPSVYILLSYFIPPSSLDTYRIV